MLTAVTPEAGAAPPDKTVAGAADPKVVPPSDSPAAPVPLELKLPEGFKPDEAVLTEFKKLAGEAGLKSEAAQKVFDLYAKTEQARAAADTKAIEEGRAAWVAAAKADKEFGGADFEKNLQVANKAMTKFAPPALKAFLDESGLGSHPEMIRLMVRVGKALAEDSIGGAPATPAGVSAADDLEAKYRRMYPSMHPKES